MILSVFVLRKLPAYATLKLSCNLCMADATKVIKVEKGIPHLQNVCFTLTVAQHYNSSKHKVIQPMGKRSTQEVHQVFWKGSEYVCQHLNLIDSWMRDQSQCSRARWAVYGPDLHIPLTFTARSPLNVSDHLQLFMTVSLFNRLRNDTRHKLLLYLQRRKKVCGGLSWRLIYFISTKGCQSILVGSVLYD